MLASGPTDDDSIRSLISEICAVACPEDGLRFDLSGLSLDVIRAEEKYSGKRARFRAFLGKARIAVQVDLGVGDAIAVSPEEITYPTILSSLPPPRLRAYPREQTVAEKFEAMVKLDTRNSRMKDFHDLWALSSAFHFDGTTLQRAIATCFERRGAVWTHDTPNPLTSAFYQRPDLQTRWRHYLAAGAVLVPPPADFSEIGERIKGFLYPVRASIVAKTPFAQSWPPLGPWTPIEGQPRGSPQPGDY